MKNIKQIAFVLTTLIILSSCTNKETKNELRTVNVKGTGIILVTPDYAQITLSVQTLDKDLIRASEENAKKINAVQEALINFGISKENITTEHYNISQDSYWEKGRQILGDFHVSNEVKIILNKIDKAGSLIDTAIKAGANRLSSISFGVSNTTEYVKQARIQAMQQAKESATVLAETSGEKLGKVFSIVEEPSRYAYEARAENMLMAKSYADAAPTSINAEKTQISVSVNVTYILQ